MLTAADYVKLFLKVIFTSNITKILYQTK